MLREVPLLPKLYFVSCDVRDVALAHIKAMVVPEAAGTTYRTQWDKSVIQFSKLKKTGTFMWPPFLHLRPSFVKIGLVSCLDIHLLSD